MAADVSRRQVEEFLPTHLHTSDSLFSDPKQTFIVLAGPGSTGDQQRKLKRGCGKVVFELPIYGAVGL